MTHALPFRILPVLFIAALAVIAGATVPPPPNSDWTIGNADSTQSALIGELSPKTGQLRWRTVAEGELVVQVTALVASGQGVVGPIGLSEIELKGVATESAAKPHGFGLLAIGVWNQGCTYLDGRDIPEKGQAAIDLGSGDQFKLENIDGSSLQLAVAAKRLHICLAFAVPKPVSGGWILRVGKYEIPVAQGINGIAASSAHPKSQYARTTASEPASGSLDIGAALSQQGWMINGAVALLLAVALVLCYRRRNLLLQHSGEPIFESHDPASSQVIPQLTETETPTTFITPEDQPGPGAAMLAAASRAMQAEDLATAGDCARQSLNLGLAPGHVGKAQLFLAEAAIARGDLLGAINAYRQCLDKNQAVLRSALPAAANLALIYRELGMQESARLAEGIIATSPNAGEALHRAWVQRINFLATAMNRSKRAHRLQSLVRFIRQLFPSGQQERAQGK